jgi:CHASE2 domain-containing sensor protein
MPFGFTASLVVVTFLSAWTLIANLGNWDDKSPKQVVIALVAFIASIAAATWLALT